MRLLLTHLDARSPIELTDGTHVLGGAPDDDVHLSPLPASLLTLRIDGASLSLESRESLRVDGLPLAAGRPRELLSGERVELPGGVTLQIAPDEGQQTPPSTRRLFLQLLGATLTPPAPHLAWMVCVSGQDRGRRFQLDADTIELGRSVDASLRLRDGAVSRLHARLERGADCWWVEDLGGLNGLWISGRSLTGRMPIYDGAILELGRTTLRLVDPSVPAPEPAVTPTPAWQSWCEPLRDWWMPGVAFLALALLAVGLLFGS